MCYQPYFVKKDLIARSANHTKGKRDMKRDFDIIWSAIVAHEGETFQTTRNLEFTYTVKGNGIISSRATTAFLSKENIENAYLNIDVYTSTQFNQKIIGSSYVRAILRDPRIK